MVCMSNNKKQIAHDEAAREIEIACKRIALLHLSYAKTLIEELGEKKGVELIAKAIKDYGFKIGEKTREDVLTKGLEPTPENFNLGESLRIPKFGIQRKVEKIEVDGEMRSRTFGCILAKLWKEYGEEKIGRLYCYVDPAKYMAYNPNFKLIHVKSEPEGDECCEFAVRPTTEMERKDFLDKNRNCLYIDK